MDFWEIATLITGIIYIVLEIKQKNFMWVVGILTGVAALIAFYNKSLYASMALNAYYVGISIWGLFVWMKDSEKLKDEKEDVIHLNRASWKAYIVSAIILLLGSILFIKILRWLGDPMSEAEAIMAVLSAIATYWLAKSYIQHWLFWIFADCVTAYICFSQHLFWMAGLYFIYSVVAFYGLYHWKSRGVYLSD